MRACFLYLRLKMLFLFLNTIILFRLCSLSRAHYLSSLMISHNIPCSDNMKQH